MTILRFLLNIFVILMIAVSAHAEWSEPVRVSWGYPLLITPRAVTIGDTIHVVAHEADMDVYYMMSPDNGETWSEPVSPSPELGDTPDIAYSDGNIHIVFEAHGLFTYTPMMHITSSDGGRHWSESHLISDCRGTPRITACHDTLFASCSYNEPYLQYLVWSSFDNGQTWNEPGIVDSGPELFSGQAPDIFYSRGRIHFIYSMGNVDDTVGIEVYYKYSDDYGVTWSERMYLSTPEGMPNVKHSQQPSGYVNSDGEIIVTWMDYKYGSRCTGHDGEILGRISTDNGNTWLPETRISRTHSGDWPSPLIVDDVLYCVWPDVYTFGYCGWKKIMYAKPDDWGNSWSTQTCISGSERLIEDDPFLCFNIVDEAPNLHCLYSIGASGGVWHILGYDEHTDIEEDNGDSIIPDMFTIGAYPNPFNSNVILTLNNPEGGDIEVVIYNLYGQEVKRFQAHGGKEVKIGWDATDAMGNKLTSGIYFARARTSHQSQIIKMTYMK